MKTPDSLIFEDLKPGEIYLLWYDGAGIHGLFDSHYRSLHQYVQKDIPFLFIKCVENRYTHWRTCYILYQGIAAITEFNSWDKFITLENYLNRGGRVAR